MLVNRLKPPGLERKKLLFPGLEKVMGVSTAADFPWFFPGLGTADPRGCLRTKHNMIHEEK